MRSSQNIVAHRTCHLNISSASGNGLVNRSPQINGCWKRFRGANPAQALVKHALKTLLLWAYSKQHFTFLKMGKCDCGFPHRRLLPHWLHSASLSMANLYGKSTGSSEKNTTSPTSGPLHVIVPIGNPTLYLSRCPLSSYFQTTEPVFPSQSRLLQETHPSLID